MNAVLKERSIQPIASGFHVEPLIRQLDAAPELWNQHKLRTDRYNTPHNGVSDIWVRFNAWENFDGDAVKFTMQPHASSWYPCIAKIPAAWSLARKVYRRVGGKQLGGILITRIPPHGEVKPHIDSGWHAEHYSKFAIQIKGNKDQAFCFEGESLSPLPGDLYTFNNSHLHWVRNDSDEERITLIMCIRT
ncbi:MAG TPA: aspartyl/asparaginyl beta-hydroxylase domain-containing protein [Candidatus Paceibacterota bacterium]